LRAQCITNPRNPVFEKHAALFTDALSHRRDPRQQAISIGSHIRRLRPLSYSILDLGCGAGDLSAGLNAQGFKVIGVDRSKQMISIAKRFSPPTSTRQWVCADFMNQSLPDKSDVVLLLYSVIQTFPTREMQQGCINKLFSYLRPNGLCFIECSHKRFSDKAYPFGDKFINRTGKYELESWCFRLSYSTRELHILAKRKNDDKDMVEFIHLLKMYDIRTLSSMIKNAGGKVIGVYASPDFTKPFDVEKSRGMLIISTPLG